MAEQRNILWPELNKTNAERIREALGIPKIDRGVHAWLSKVIAAALKDWADELATGTGIDKETAWAYGELYATEVYVKQPWAAKSEKRPVLNARFQEDGLKHIDTIGAELDRWGVANARARAGYNSAAVVLIALDKYAKKLELTKGMVDGA